MEQNIKNGDEELFRDKIATVDQEGKRIWIYPKKPKGRFTNYRTYLSYVFLLVLFGLPFVKVNGRPWVLFNILEREFILFGVHFSPQDFYLFAIGMIILIVFITLFTVIFGRLFCGWVCPQTVFMEMVFRKIEYWIEGDYTAQRRLDASPWTSDKWIKKAIKHIIFYGIALLISNTFLAYIIGLDEVIKIISEPIRLHVSGFVAMLIFSVVFYLVFAKLREQVCTTICPYGRLQGVLLDNKSLVVAYDYIRGEPRGKIKKSAPSPIVPTGTYDTGAVSSSSLLSDNEQKQFLDTLAPKQGDCIDCKLCIHVCPTGIDIRNGTQLECVNCTACMDACDEVMDKIDRPRGLIRIDSLEGIEKGERRIFNTRSIAYSLVLLLLIGVETMLFMTRSDVEVLLLRTPGMLYQKQEDGRISNLYNYQLINKTDMDLTLSFRIKSHKGDIKFVGDSAPHVSSNGKSEGALFVILDKSEIHKGKNNLKVDVLDQEGKIISTVETSFFGSN